MNILQGLFNVTPTVSKNTKIKHIGSVTGLVARTATITEEII